MKDKVDELFSPVVQFLHEHEQHHHEYHNESTDECLDPPTTAVTKSTSDDLSSSSCTHSYLDLNGHVNATTSPYYNTENDDEDNEEKDTGVDFQDHHDLIVDHDHDDDDVSMSRPEQHDATNEGEFNPWQFIASLPPYESVVVHLPPRTLPPLVEYKMGVSATSLSTSPLRKTLVLDLDETLVHCSVSAPTDGQVVDFTFPVQFHGETYAVHVKCRPYLQQFLNEMCRHFEVIVFTASQKVYADALLNIIDRKSTRLNSSHVD